MEVNNEFSKRGEGTSPFKQASSSKSSSILACFNRGKDSYRQVQGKDIAPFESKSPLRKSPLKRNESPNKEGRSTLEVRPLDYFKRENSEQKPYLETRTNTNLATRKQDIKEDIRQILNTGRTPRGRSEVDMDRMKATASQKFLDTRTSRVELLKPGLLLGNESSSTLKSGLTENLKNSRLLGKDNHHETSSRSEYMNQGDHGRSKQKVGIDLKSILSPNSGTTQDSFSLLKMEAGIREKDNEKKEKLISDHLSLQKLYEIQDLFYNASDKGFDALSSDYIEELIKLSSVIMHRVKNSSYYNKT